MTGKRSFRDIAVLYRTHHQARILEKCFQQEGIPYIVSGREEFLEDPLIQGSISFSVLWQNRIIHIIKGCLEKAVGSGRK